MSLQPAAFATMAAMGPAVARARPDAAPANHASGARAGEAMRVGRQFERMFLSQMLAPIFDTIRTDGPFGGGHAESMMRSFQVDAYAASIVGKGGIGLAPRIAAEILRMQENSNG